MGHFRGRRFLTGSLLACFLLAFGAISASAGGGAPTVETERASGIGRTSVTLKALVNPNGTAVSECYFEYGTSEGSLTSTAPCSYSPGEVETPVPVEATVTGLSETTEYFFRIHAVSAGGASSGSIRHFASLPNVPIANTEPPSTVGRTGATLRGFVTPGDSEVTECFFEWGTAPGELTHTVACFPMPGSGAEPVEVQASLAGLSESTVYYFRLAAKNSFGLERGGRSNFETLPSRPHANTEPATEVGHTSAVLHGFVTPNGLNVESCSFQWGTASVEEHSTPCEQTEIGSGEAPVAVSATLTGLSESTSYKFRLVATDSQGRGEGGTIPFATLPNAAKVNIQRPVELTDTTATLHAKVFPQGVAVTECRFEYGTTPALGKSVPCSSLPGGGETPVLASAAVSGLTPTTTYLDRIRVANVFGVTYSHTEAFTTYEAGLLPVVTKVKPAKGSSAGGTAVTVKGKNLENAVAVRFGETETTAITSDTPESLTVTAPPGVGVVDVVVVTPSGESALSSADHFTYGAPIIEGLSPSSGPKAGGTIVTVTGYGFEPGIGATKFVFGKVIASAANCSSANACKVRAPASTKAGNVKVRAIVAGKGSKSAPAAVFTYEP